MTTVDLRVDVTEAAGLSEQLETAVTVTLPALEALASRPIVCFAWPGGGYSRRYFTFDMPGGSDGGQAGWHAERGWIFVSCDHLYVGESSHPVDPTALTYENLAATNRATVDDVLTRLAKGTLAEGFPPIVDPVTIGIGQSMGACLLVVQQGQLRTFDGIGVLGYSAKHTVLWMPPGSPDLGSVYVPRGSGTMIINGGNVSDTTPAMAPEADGLPGTTPGFHYDDEPPDIVAADMIDYPTRRGQVPEWGSGTIPPCAVSMMSPGTIAPEAASVTVPVFVGVGERDVCPTPLAEPAAYARSSDVTVFVCPRMSHMHNFASSREQLWTRLESWAAGVASMLQS